MRAWDLSWIKIFRFRKFISHFISLKYSILCILNHEWKSIIAFNCLLFVWKWWRVSKIKIVVTSIFQFEDHLLEKIMNSCMYFDSRDFNPLDKHFLTINYYIFIINVLNLYRRSILNAGKSVPKHLIWNNMSFCPSESIFQSLNVTYENSLFKNYVLKVSPIEALWRNFVFWCFLKKFIYAFNGLLATFDIFHLGYSWKTGFFLSRNNMNEVRDDKMKYFTFEKSKKESFSTFFSNILLTSWGRKIGYIRLWRYFIHKKKEYA